LRCAGRRHTASAARAARAAAPRGAGRRRAVSLAITVALLFSGLVFLAPPARVYAQGNVASVNAAAASLVAVNAVAAGDAAGSAISGEPAEVRNPGFEEDILSDPRTAGVHGWNLYDYRDQQANEPGTSTLSYDTEFYRSGAASFRIDSIRINDVRLYQKVPVRPDSIYRISCWVAADAVSDDGVGANVSVIGLFSMSEDVKEDRDGGFSLVELYGRTGPKQEELEISVGLGGYSNESFGTAWFDDVSVERFDAAPPGAEINNFFAEDSGGQSDGAQPNEMPAPVRFVLMCAALLLLGLVVSIAIRGGGGAPGMASDSAPAQSPAAVAPAVTGGTHGAAWGAAFRLDRRDAVIMAAMTAVYLVIAFIRLGGFSAPQTYWKPVEDTDSIVFDLGGAAKIQKVLYNCNALQHNEYESAFELFALSAGEAGATGADAAAETETATLLCRLDDKAFYEWKSVGVVGEAARLRLDAVTPGMSLNEIAFYGVDASGKEGLLPVTIAQSSVSDHDVGEPRFLIDEQDTVPERPDILNGTYFDEIYFARTAYEHIHSLPIYETTHPPLGKLVTALGILIFGMNPFGWRIMGMLAGAAMIPVMYLFGKRLFGGRAFAFCAAFLMMFDFMHFAQTRLSTIDSYATLLILLMYLFMLDSFMHGISGRGPRDVLIPLGLSGLAFGLGASVKWIALYGGLGIAFLFFVARAREIRGVFGFDTGSASAQPQGQPSHAGSRSGSGSGRARSGSNSGSGRTHSRSYTRSRFRARSRGAAARAGERAYLSRLGVVLCASLVFFVLVPGLIYLLSYIPYTQVPGEQGGLFKVMMDNQASMLDYHSKLTDTHPFESVWWSWPLNIKPIWYYSASGLPAALKASVASFGNPLIWWVGIPCLIAAFYLAYRKGDRHMAVVFAAFLFQYCPWIFISRATFIYHYFSSAPFVIFAIVYVLKALVEAKVVTFRAVGLYLTAVAALFVFYYPVLSGLPVAKSYADALRLFSSWLW
jgi:predicted membrane-bound dolichyl-phosphate-mannose-protein mannosyltransferase